jgi:predicted Zn-dependent protease
MSEPQYSSRNPPPSNRQLLTLAGIFIGFVALIIWAIAWFFNVLILLIPPSLEQQLGSIVVPIYEQQAQNSPVQDTLNQLINRLESRIQTDEKKDSNYRVLYLPDETINALAIPGNVVIIYRGLIEEMESENELMMVLGHELGHFAHRDHLRGLGRSLLLKAAIAYFLGDTGGWSAIAASAVESIGNAQYSQSQERQADEFGLQLLNNTYGHVAGATDFFARLSKKQGVDWAILSTHPAPKSRVKHLEELIKKENYQIKVRSPLPESLKRYN